jgi:glycosyltransferase involved in cell wall biosynthesis
MSNKPRVSIGLPVFNGENYLAAALDSIHDKTFGSFEVVICDNASTDGTEEICRRYAAHDRRVRYHRNEMNLGASANFNRTFELSIGTYFKWAAHDDLIAPTYLERCVAALDSEPDAALAQSIVRIIGETGETRDLYHGNLQQAGGPRASTRLGVLTLKPRGWREVFGLIRRSALERTALIAPYPFSDVTLCIELALLGRFVFVPEPLFMNREHPARFTSVCADKADRQATWHWWCAPGSRPSDLKFLHRCPNWYVQLNILRAIQRHVPTGLERRLSYAMYLRQLASPHNSTRLAIELIDAMSPRILAPGRRWKQVLSRRARQSLQTVTEQPQD